MILHVPDTPTWAGKLAQPLRVLTAQSQGWEFRSQHMRNNPDLPYKLSTNRERDRDRSSAGTY